jgi:hypothetical protein
MSMVEPLPRHAWLRLRPALIHLVASALVAGLGTYALVRLWYPAPYASLAGGLQLLGLLITVDVVLGPALTLVVANPGKPVRVLARDLAVILLVQLAALAYGLYTLALARPVGLVFEVDQFRVISAADIEPVMLADAPPALRELSWSGPRTFAAIKPTDQGDLLQAMQLGMAGIDLAMLPKHWREYASQTDAAWKRAQPVSTLIAKQPAAAKAIEALAAQARVPAAELRFLPLRSRRSDDWITLVAAPDARVVGHLQLDGRR